MTFISPREDSFQTSVIPSEQVIANEINVGEGPSVAVIAHYGCESSSSLRPCINNGVDNANKPEEVMMNPIPSTSQHVAVISSSIQSCSQCPIYGQRHREMDHQFSPSFSIDTSDAIEDTTVEICPSCKVDTDFNNGFNPLLQRV